MIKTTVADEKTASQQVEQQCVNLLRFLSVDMVQKADSGHPGLPLDAAPMAFVLWTKFLRFNPKNPDWFNRDRFILSAGHGSALLYSLLYATGYDLSLDDIRQFRQWGSKTPGHPERYHTPGVEMTTGPLGQGFANGVGMAITEAHLAACFNRPGHEVIHHYTYSIVSDGDLMEGISSEAASLAGHLKLGKLIYLYDNNHVSLSANTDITFTENIAERFEAMGWHTAHVYDGNDLNALHKALESARHEEQKPSLIIVHTHLGYGSPKQDSYKAHGSPLGEEDVRKTKENLNWPDQQFYVPEEALAHFRKSVDQGRQEEEKWQKQLEAYRKAFPDLAQAFDSIVHKEQPVGWDADIPQFQPDAKGVSTRVASGKIMNAMANKVPALMGGSADLNPSTYTDLKDMGDFAPPEKSHPDRNYAGRNIWFGVREHAMGAILNGMAAHGGVIPYGATFLIFSDYMRPPIRLASLMQLKVIYVFTHDSIGLGEDGPTHQPIEQLACLRAVPRLSVIRPADANETVIAWKIAIEANDHPTALILSRQDLPILDRAKFSSAEGTRQGAYLLSDAPNGKPDIILIASGSEVQLIVEAGRRLEAEGIHARLVSMPSWDLFNAQSQEYRDKVLSPAVNARLSVEAGCSQGWDRYVGAKGVIISIDHFGESAPGPTLMTKFGFTADNVYEQTKTLLKNQKI